MGRNLENFRKIPKMSGEKKLFFCQTRAVTCVIDTSIELQHFFFARHFFFWGKWGKIFFDPPRPPRLPPVTPGSVSQFARPLGRSTVGPQKNPRLHFPGQKSGSLRFFLFRPKWTWSVRADFWAYSGGFFLSLAKKWVEIWKKIRKIPKMSGKKKLFFCQTRAVRCVIGTPIQLQHFFFRRNFFLGGKCGKIFFGPPDDPRLPPATPG